MDPTPGCLHLVIARPRGMEPGRWLAAWTTACAGRRVPDLRSFSIGEDRCSLHIQRRHGHADLGLSANLDIVAGVLASCGAAVPMDLAPRPAVASEIACPVGV